MTDILRSGKHNRKMKEKKIPVQGTNDHSSLSKLSAANKGYYEDEFLKFFKNKSSSRCPLINRGYYLRFKVMEFVFEAWSEIVKELNAETYQVISLGAGFDTTYFRLKKRMKLSGRYIEIDFPEVVENKKKCIQQHEELKKYLKNDFESSQSQLPEIKIMTSDYMLLGLDLKNTEKLQQILENVNVDFSIPTMFLSECCITYMNIEHSNRLISWASKTFCNSAFVTYEQVHPYDDFGQIMQKHFCSLGSPLKSVLKYPDMKSQQLRYLNLGWSICELMGIKQFWKSLPEPERNRVSKLESFDEHETWDLKCDHYALTWACQGTLNCIPFPETASNCEVDPSSIKSIQCKSVRHQVPSQAIHRYGHQITRISSDVCLISGGFGSSDKNHCRLKKLVWQNVKTQESGNVIVEPFESENIIGGRMYHQMVSLSNQKIVIYGGRTSPEKLCTDTILLTPQESYSITGSNVHFKCNIIEEKGDSPKARWRHTCCTVSLNGDEHIFMFGGSLLLTSATDCCYLLNTTTWTWSEVQNEDKTPAPCYSHSCSYNIAKNEVVIAGGHGKSKILNSVHSYCFNKKTWTELNVVGFQPRYSHTSHIIGNQLFLVGGISNVAGFVPFMARIDLSHLSTIEILRPGEDIEFPILLCNHQSLMCDEDKLIVIGGGGMCFSFGTHFNQHLIELDLTCFMEVT